MANIDMTPELKDAFIQRIQVEIGQTLSANFTLDILVTATQQRLIAVEQALKDANDQNAALQLRCQTVEAELIDERELTYRLAKDLRRFG